MLYTRLPYQFDFHSQDMADLSFCQTYKQLIWGLFYNQMNYKSQRCRNTFWHRFGLY
ncbi:hypothetical protein F220043C3_20460 [Enterocloster asparagiformis]